MKYQEAYNLYDKKYARRVGRQQKIIRKMWDKADKNNGVLSEKDLRKYNTAQDKIIEYENEIVSKAEELSGEKAI